MRFGRAVRVALFLGAGCASCAAPPVDTPAPQPGIVSRVLDATTRQPLAGATISATPSTGSVSVASDGAYRTANVPSGLYEVQARRDRYEGASTIVTVHDGDLAVADPAGVANDLKSDLSHEVTE